MNYFYFLTETSTNGFNVEVLDIFSILAVLSGLFYTFIIIFLMTKVFSLSKNYANRDCNSISLQARISYSGLVIISGICLTEGIKSGVSLDSIIETVKPLECAVNEVAPVVPMAEQGILQLVCWKDALAKADYLVSLNNIVKTTTSSLLPSYNGDTLLSVNTVSERCISEFKHNFISRSYSYPIYIKTQHLIYILPLIIVLFRNFLIATFGFLQCMFSLISKILWEPTLFFPPATQGKQESGIAKLIKKALPYVQKTSEAKWSYWINTPESNNSQSETTSKASTGINSGSNDGSGDGNRNNNNRPNSPNYYEKIPKTLMGLIELLKDIISTLEYIRDFLSWVFSLQYVRSRVRREVGLNPIEHRVLWYISMIEKGQLSFKSNFWQDHYSNFHAGLLYSLYTLGVGINVFNVIAYTIENLNYGQTELGDFSLFFNLRQDRILISDIMHSIDEILPHLLEQLAILEKMFG